VVSFFVRAANAYDTLLQMGRWFGYRAGYADLPRIWMTEELEGYFWDLATVEQEVRNDIRRYELENLTPHEFGVRIRTHPVLGITSRLKMQSAVDCDVSYSDRRIQTVLFRRTDKAWLERNSRAARELVRRLRQSGIEPERCAGGRILFREAGASHVLGFLADYAFHENSVELRGDLIRSYVAAQNREESLLRWNVVIIGKAAGTERITLGDGVDVIPIERSRLDRGSPENADIGVLMTDADRLADLDIARAEIEGKAPAELQAMRTAPGPGASKGLLLIYPISKDSRPMTGRAGRQGTARRVALDAAAHVMGVGIVFPRARHDTPQRYMTVDLSGVQRELLELPEDELDAPRVGELP
jgi:hypothetical protein